LVRPTPECKIDVQVLVGKNKIFWLNKFKDVSKNKKTTPVEWSFYFTLKDVKHKEYYLA